MRSDLTHRLGGLAASVALVCASTACRAGTHLSASAAGSSAASSGPAATLFTGPAVAEYGQPAVQLAYKQMLAFTFDNGWNPSLIRTHVDSVRATDFSTILNAMTPQCAATFKAAFAKVEKHDKAAIRTMEGAVFFGVKGPKGALPSQTTGLITNRKYSQVTLGIDRLAGVDRVSLGFTAKADIHLQDTAGKSYVLPTSRIVRYLLVPNSGKDKAARPFLISVWKNTMTASHIAPAP